jgi:hypothetical protein
MADFTVIEGGGSGPPENEAVDAGRAFRMMIVEVLRALARGDDPEERIASLLVDFTRHASSMKTPLSSVIADVISELHEEVIREGPRDYGEEESRTSSERPLRWPGRFSLTTASPACASKEK